MDINYQNFVIYYKMSQFMSRVFLKSTCIKIIKLLIYKDNIKYINFIRKKKRTDVVSFGIVSCPLWKFLI
jgi:hypothetical protein